jgi:hypothetical protein
MKVFLISLFFLLGFFARAQQDRFIYLQSENKQSFFVKLNDKTFNSSPLGYVIIPNLQDGLYSLKIGSPQGISEQEFNCSIKNKDVGFVIKNSGENQWQLLNMQSQAVIVPGQVVTKISKDTLQKETDPFSTMLASAVNDSTILQKDIVKEVVPEKVPDVIQKDSSQVIVAKTEVAITKPVAKKKVKKTVHPVKETVDEQKSIPTETVINNFNKDTVMVVAVQSDTAVSRAVTYNDSVKQKDVAKQQVIADIDAKPITKEKIKRKTKPVTQSDSEVKGSDRAVAKSDNKADSITYLGGDNVLAKSSTKQKINGKKTVQTSGPLITENTEVKTNERPTIKDTAQVVAVGNDISPVPAKLKVKQKKKNDQQDTIMIKKDVINNTDVATVKEPNKAQSPPFINFDNTATPLSIIKRKSKKNTKEGLEMLYVEVDGDTRDTIRVLIPVEKRIREEAKPERRAETSSIPVATPTQSEMVNTEQKNKITKEPVAKVAMINSDCKSVATDDDFMKMRKKMVAENTDEDMVRAAKKVFKTKCFTTEQIKNLSVLFLKDQGKYMFFDAAYPFAADTELYSTLQSQLTDEYYITRFRAMIHK